VDQNNDYTKDLDDGVLVKSAEVTIQEVTEEDLKKINKFALSPLKAEEVFTFKVVLGDNETDDRNFEPFNLNALKDLTKLYVGKTVIKDHFRRADNQVARIYDTELITEPKLTKAGEPFAKLVAKCYMVKTASNEDLITEIKAGIKKEVSTSCKPKKLICNICGTDNMKTYCPHWGGREYDKDSGKTTCLMTIDGAKEAYELSFVAVGAQPRAGTTKRYGVKPEEVPEDTTKTEEIPGEKPEIEESENKDAETNLRIRYSESFIFTQKHNSKKEEI
jgi:hypothetical protein